MTTPSTPENLPLLPRALVLKAGILLEGGVAIVALLWITMRGFEFSLTATGEALALASAFTVIMITFNLGLMHLTLNQDATNAAQATPPFLSRWRVEFRTFYETVIVRMVGNLDARSAAILALLSGFAEELLFRGALWQELLAWCGLWPALFLSSALFSIAHFGREISLFPRVAALYFVYGLLLGGLFMATDSLLAVMAAHAMYNFLAFTFITQGFASTGSRHPV
jgi:membrane protease YdiL (CAAX protease family)